MLNKKTFIIHPELKSRNSIKSSLIKKRSAEDKLSEAVSVAKSINLEVFSSEIVSITKICPGNFIGKGKIQEISVCIEENEIDLVIVNTKITPIQQSNLEKSLKCKVIDRTELILEIFGARAKTKEGRLQVELAAQEYQKSRLVRSWTHLERQRSGGGFMGGPGEKQIESDKRAIRERIINIKKRLEKVVKTRKLHRKSREKIPYKIVSLIGYTNVGKSTLFNYLTKASVVAENKLFATLDPTMRLINIPGEEKVILSDTVGFISDLPIELVLSFRSTLEEVITSDIILHVRDISCHDTEEQKQDVLEVLGNLLTEEQIYSKIIEVFNKTDLLSKRKYELLKSDYNNNEDKAIISSVTGYGTQDLLQKIVNKLNSENNIIELKIKNSSGKIISWIYEHSMVSDHTNNKENIHIKCSISNKNLGRLKKILSEDTNNGFIIQ